MSKKSEQVLAPALPKDVIGRILWRLSYTLAIIGGLIFLILVAVSLVSIVGRKLFAAPVPGDMELLEMAAASAGACFFAYCHITYTDLKVDLLTIKLNPRVNAFLDFIASIAMVVFAYLLMWRTFVAAQGTLESGESSAILALPVAWFQFAMVPGFFMLMLTALYTAYSYLYLAFSKNNNVKGQV